MIRPELSREDLLIVNTEAYVALEKSREGRVDPLTAKSHSDHWAHELYVYTLADIARGNVEQAQEMFDFWLERITPEGRVPHLIVDTTSLRRRFIDGPIVEKAKKLENGAMATPHSGIPMMSMTALAIAEALPEGSTRESWVQKVLPGLEKIKLWQYQERDMYRDGLIVQTHPDETFFRHGTGNKEALERLKESKLSRLEEKTRNNQFVQNVARLYLQLKGGGKVLRRGDSTYDAGQYMSLRTAAKLYGAKDDFRLQDVAVNGVMIADNQAIEELYAIAGKTIPDHLKINFMKTRSSLNKLWDEESGAFVSRLPQSNELLAGHMGAEPYIALLGRAAMSTEQFNLTLSALERDTVARNFPVSTGHEDGLIHRGAMHPMVNFLMFNALESDIERERNLKQAIGESVVQAYLASKKGKNGHGKFSEGYNSVTGTPIGASYWGPTAAANVIFCRALLDQ